MHDKVERGVGRSDVETEEVETGKCKEKNKRGI